MDDLEARDEPYQLPIRDREPTDLENAIEEKKHHQNQCHVSSNSLRHNYDRLSWSYNDSSSSSRPPSWWWCTVCITVWHHLTMVTVGQGMWALSVDQSEQLPNSISTCDVKRDYYMLLLFLFLLLLFFVVAFLSCFTLFFLFFVSPGRSTWFL